jgi:hypothetical protein
VLIVTVGATLEDTLVTMMLSKKARRAVVAKLIMVAAVPAEKCTTFVSKLPLITLV